MKDVDHVRGSSIDLSKREFLFLFSLWS